MNKNIFTSNVFSSQWNINIQELLNGQRVTLLTAHQGDVIQSEIQIFNLAFSNQDYFKEIEVLDKPIKVWQRLGVGFIFN